MIMLEPDSQDRPFHLRTSLDPPRTVRRAAQFVRFLFARSLFGRRELPVVSVDAAWLRLLSRVGERLEAWHRTEVLEFLRLWSDAKADAVAFFRASASVDPATSGTRGRVPRSGNPQERKLTQSGLYRPAMLIGIDPTDASPNRKHSFSTIDRTSDWQIVRHDFVSAETARAARRDAGLLKLRPSVQGYEDDQSNHGIERPRPVHQSVHTIHPWLTTRETADFPALSSAETMASRTVGMKAFPAGHDHPEGGSGLGAQRADSVSLLHTAGARQDLRIGPPQTRQFAHAPGDTDPAPSWSFQAAQSLGRPLGIIPRVTLERSFPDLNLSQVRVHTDAPADTAARELGADAFAVGPDLFFRSGTFNPLTERGLALLTHELVHVRQSGDGLAPASTVMRERLEGEALRAEAIRLSPALTASPRRGWTGPDAVTTRLSSRQLLPLSLDFVRSEAAYDRGGTNSPQASRSVPIERLADSRPFTAGAGRTATMQEQSAGEGIAASGAEDLNGLSRHFFRALERKIVIEKERRGGDRWVP